MAFFESILIIRKMDQPLEMSLCYFTTIGFDSVARNYDTGSMINWFSHNSSP